MEEGEMGKIKRQKTKKQFSDDESYDSEDLDEVMEDLGGTQSKVFQLAQ